MEAKAKALGHAIHPMLIVFPLGLLSTAVIFEVLFYAMGERAYATVTYYLLISGVIGGLLAAVAGFIDWTSIPEGTRAKRVGLIHGVVNFVVVLLFAFSWLLRSSESPEPSFLASLLAGVGFLLALVGGWLGGELVERLGIAVHDGAHPNAPSSLSTETPTPAASNVRNFRKA